MAVDDLDATALMPLETPVLKVSRPVAACSRCRNAKIKCDGKLPVRAASLTMSTPSTDESAGVFVLREERQSGRMGKERSYVSTLETKIDRLQARLEEARARKPSVVSIPDDETAVPSRRQSYSVQEPVTSTTSKAQRRKETSAIDDLVSDFGYLSVNATARDFYGFTSAMSYARLILSACTKDPLPQGTTKALPARYAATALVQHYLKNIFVLLPVFDEATFYASVESVYSRHSGQAEPLDHWMVHMVLAIANVSMSEQRGDHQYLEGIGHVCAALGYAEEVLHPGSISSVQALVLLTEYAMLDPHHLDSWSLIGAASRAMVDLGLHQDPPKGSAMAKSKLELRRRVFHCVYALDRTTSLVQTRAFSFSDDSAKVKIPFTKISAVQPSPLNGNGSQKSWLQSYEQALDLINLRQLQSTFYTDMFQSGRAPWEEPYPYVWNTCDTLRKWFANISSSTSQNMRAFFEVDLLYSYVYVLSPSPRVPTIDSFAAKLIFEYCIRYADLMLRFISDPSYTAPMTFYDAMRVYMTGRQFLDVLRHNTELLLSGFVPNHPPVRPSSAPPPPMPVIPLPPDDTVLHFNTSRSYNCIRQITDCLSKFGLRWGYMSWSLRYQSETAGMLEELGQRLRDMDEMSGRRRPSMWQHTSSSGSVHSGKSSIQYSSPQTLPPGPAAYRQPSITAYNMTSYGNNGIPPQTSPPQHHYSVQNFNQMPVQPFEQQQQQQATYHGHPPQQFSYTEPPARERHPNFNMPPSLQFAGWGGYGGPSASNQLDDENARKHQDLLKVAPWIDTGPPDISPSTEQPPDGSLRNPITVPDAPPAPIRLPGDSEQHGGSSSDSQSSGNSVKRSRRRSILESLIPSRLSRRRKKTPKVKGPTSAPRQVGESSGSISVGGPSSGSVGDLAGTRRPGGDRAAVGQGVSGGEVGGLPGSRLESSASLAGPSTSSRGDLTALRQPGPSRAAASSRMSLSSLGILPNSRQETAASTGSIGDSTALRQPQHSRAAASSRVSLSSLGILPTSSRGPENELPHPSLRPQSSTYSFSIPPSSTMPPLAGRGPAQPPPERRPSSMQDFAADMFTDMITPGMMMSSYYAPPPPPPPDLARLRSPRASRSPRQRRRDDGSGKRPVSRTRGDPIDDPSAASASAGPSTSFLQPPPHPTAYTNTNTYPNLYAPYTYSHYLPVPPPHPLPFPPQDIPGFTTLPGVGYSCHTCHLVVQQPELHTSDGVSFCFNAVWDPFATVQGPRGGGV
ncbi:hypothetical protein LTR91_025274 [Friedmanniomyces endolithicus]|uniref:Xylanolytic transcriptional activator regulatory domain-containing protein n=1 Tax=Friedmanniomyces endolithicus TaxID=329885 RepID=A0AAN6H153_9PEZI|nr:hypothetical protein LTR94_005678 [Friedmanniomyces endolithicus]KAK0798186.1 hypothetical protein LTR59_006498 [Friedmanniomyces endolithicus]KAK0805052.1 hypothetical protein LTR38_005583 [Friedmanniomyces endolithicus]KAK0809711.1 hypothetical protein LTR75_005810 [Friedmanniomyces endolithicus]KAK0837489.1 hypothetical protein LTR03_012737 [Friedmanniomyces endolithicus]